MYPPLQSRKTTMAVPKALLADPCVEYVLVPGRWLGVCGRVRVRALARGKLQALLRAAHSLGYYLTSHSPRAEDGGRSSVPASLPVPRPLAAIKLRLTAFLRCSQCSDS